MPDLIKKALARQRPLQIFGSGEQTRTLTHVDDVADGIVTAMSSPAALNEDFNISAARELTIAEIARIVWDACGEDADAFELEHLPSLACDVQRRWPSVEKARQLLGWRGADRASRTASPQPCAGCASASAAEAPQLAESSLVGRLMASGRPITGDV